MRFVRDAVGRRIGAVGGVCIRRGIALALLALSLSLVGAACAQQPGGEQLFAENCARCHGLAADGTSIGPPLVHRLYEPGHHPDFSFRSAVNNGVISHHWDFGDMPPVAGLSDDEISAIIAHIRGLQRDGGIIIR